jgi:hypothetical protein
MTKTKTQETKRETLSLRSLKRDFEWMATLMQEQDKRVAVAGNKILNLEADFHELTKKVSRVKYLAALALCVGVSVFLGTIIAFWL